MQYYSKRPQVQERLTNQIGEELKAILNTEDVAVIIDAKHLCVSSRGIKDDTSATVTSYFGGVFNTPEKIAELMESKTLPMLSDIRDESTESVRLIIEPKSRNLSPEMVMETLFKKTDLETRVSLNLNVIDEKNIPGVKSLKESLKCWLDHRQIILQRKSKYRLSQIENRINILTVRAGNVIGGGDWAEDRLIPDFIRALSKGENISIRSPKAIRPWQHVLDPLYGYLLLGAKLQEEPKKYSEAFNFGPETEDVNTVKELVEIAIKSWGHGEASFPKITNKLHEAGLLKLDIEKAKTQLGWKPQYQAETAIQKTIEWYKNAKPNPAEYTLNQIEEFLATPA